MRTVIRPWPQGFNGRPTLTFCVNVRKEEFVQSCGRRGSPEIIAAVKGELAARGVDVDVQTIECLGLCAKGPNARLAPANSWFHQMTPADAPEVVATVAREIEAMRAAASSGASS